MPRLRGHHLICLHFYRGEGYDRSFILNLEATIEAAEKKGVTVEQDADDICARCSYLTDQGCHHSAFAQEEVTAMDSEALSLLDTYPGEVIEWSTIQEALPRLFKKWHDSFCGHCPWKSACAENDRYKALKVSLCAAD